MLLDSTHNQLFASSQNNLNKNEVIILNELQYSREWSCLHHYSHFNWKKKKCCCSNIYKYTIMCKPRHICNMTMFNLKLIFWCIFPLTNIAPPAILTSALPHKLKLIMWLIGLIQRKHTADCGTKHDSHIKLNAGKYNITINNKNTTAERFWLLTTRWNQISQTGRSVSYWINIWKCYVTSNVIFQCLHLCHNK